MSTLREDLDEYLVMRRALGFQLDKLERLAGGFIVPCVDTPGSSAIDADLSGACAAQAPGVQFAREQPQTSVARGGFIVTARSARRPVPMPAHPAIVAAPCWSPHTSGVNAPTKSVDTQQGSHQQTTS